MAIAAIYTHDRQALFSRPSSAYLGGVEYGVNAPRFLPGGGVMVEEGTTNLLTANQASVETDLTGFFKRSGNEIHTRVTNEHWHGLASLKVDTPGLVLREGFLFTKTLSASTTYTFSAWLKGVGTVRIEITGGASGNSANINLTPTWTRHSLTFTTTTGANVNMIVCTAGSVQAITFYADGLQLEQKNFATSWHLPGTSRARESLTLPGSGLSPAAGTLVVDVEINEVARRQVAGQYPTIFTIRGSSGHVIEFKHLQTALFRLAATGTGGTTGVNFADNLIPDGARRLWCAWDGEEKTVWLYCDADSSPVATIMDAELPADIIEVQLSGYDDTTMANVPFRAARLDSVIRGAAERSGPDAPLRVDEYTLGLWRFNGHVDNVIPLPGIVSQRLDRTLFGGAGRTLDGSMRGVYHAQRRAWRLKTSALHKPIADMIVDYLLAHPWAHWFWLDEFGPESNRIKAYIDIEEYDRRTLGPEDRRPLNLTVSEQG